LLPKTSNHRAFIGRREAFSTRCTVATAELSINAGSRRLAPVRLGTIDDSGKTAPQRALLMTIVI
jgi:hypothetical protein